MKPPDVPPPPDRLRHTRNVLRRMLHAIVSLHGSPEEIARGAAIGMFVAFTPTLGLQMVIAAFLATLLNSSRAAAIVPVWITNPLTMVPIYSLTYQVGRYFSGGPAVREVLHRLRGVARRIASHDFWELHDRFRELMSLGWEVFWPMTLGGALVGTLAAAVTYPVILSLVRSYRRLQEHRRSLRRAAAGR